MTLAPSLLRHARLAFTAWLIQLVPVLLGDTPTPVFLFSTLAGSPQVPGSADGVGAAARFYAPRGVAVDASGNVYVTDDINGTIRKITPAGVVSTLAGTAGVFGNVNGLGAAARFSAPFGTLSPDQLLGKTLASAPDGTLFVADRGNYAIRQVSPSGNVTTLAGGTLGYADDIGSAKFGKFLSIKIERSGDLLVADMTNETIRRVTLKGVVSTVAGHPWLRQNLSPSLITPGPPPSARDGDSETATFFSLMDTAITPSGEIYALDQSVGCGAVRRIGSDGSVTTIAGTLSRAAVDYVDGTGESVRFHAPTGLAADSEGNLYVTDSGNRRIRHVTREGVVTTVAGGDAGTADGLGTSALFLGPSAICLDRDDNLYIADTLAHTIRKGTRVRKPVITAAPRDLVTAPGTTIALRVVASSIVPVTYQWFKNGADITGATGESLTLSGSTDTVAGSYTVAVSNAAGTTMSPPALVSLQPPPSISSQPRAQTLLGGQTLTLSVSAAGSGTFNYQWQKNGTDIPGATNATLIIQSARAEDAGGYRAIVSNAAGTSMTDPALITVNTARIANLSIRAMIGPLSPMLTVGFVTAGNNKRLLARAVGPGLRQFNLSAAHDDPRMTLYAGDAVLTHNDNWSTAGDSTQISEVSSRIGAFPLPAGSADAAILSSFQNGAYTAQIAGAPSLEGIVLVELYDANTDVEARLANVSTRGHVGTGDNVLVGGFVIVGNSSKTLLIRAIGPSLALFGVRDALANPRLDIIRSGGTTALASNDGWGGTRELSTVASSLGAFPLASAESKDAAVLVTLEPGNYSAQVSGVSGATGEALLEIYEVR